MSCVVWIGRVKGRDFSTLKKAGLDPRQFFDVDTATRFIEHHGKEDPCPLFAIVCAEIQVFHLLDEPSIQALRVKTGVRLFCTDDNALEIDASSVLRGGAKRGINNSNSSGVLAILKDKAQLHPHRSEGEEEEVGESDESKEGGGKHYNGPSFPPLSSSPLSSSQNSTRLHHKSSTILINTESQSIGKNVSRSSRSPPEGRSPKEGTQPVMAGNKKSTTISPTRPPVAVTLEEGSSSMKQQQPILHQDPSNDSFQTVQGRTTTEMFGEGGRESEGMVGCNVSMVAQATMSAENMASLEGEGGRSDENTEEEEGEKNNKNNTNNDDPSENYASYLPQNTTFVSADVIQAELSSRFIEASTASGESSPVSNSRHSMILGSMVELIVPPPRGLPAEAQFNGEGPAGSVWRIPATPVGGIPLAVRVVPSGREHEFRGPVEAQMKLKHPKISGPIRVDYDEQGIKYIYAHAFQAHIEKNFKGEIVPESITFRVLNNVTTVMAFVHSQQMLARSLSAYQVVFDYDNEIRVSSSYMVDEKHKHDVYDWIILTYAAPESITDRIFNQKSDMWGLGCVALRLVSGMPPWSGTKLEDRVIVEMMEEIWQLKDQIKINEMLLSFIPASTNPTLKKFICSCLNVDPEKRPTAEQLLQSDIFQNLMPLQAGHDGNDPELDQAVYTLTALRTTTPAFQQVKDDLARGMLKQSDGFYLDLVGASRITNELVRKRFNIKKAIIGGSTSAFYGAPSETIAGILRYGLLRSGHRLNPVGPHWKDRGTIGSTKLGIYVSKYPAHSAKFASPDQVLSVGSTVDIVMFEVALGKHKQLDLNEVSHTRLVDSEVTQGEHNTFVDAHEYYLLDESQVCPTYVLRCRVRAPNISFPGLATSYQVLMNRTLGKGSFGSVKLAIQYPKGIPVAVKIFGCNATLNDCRAEFDTLLKLREFKHIMKVWNYYIKEGTAYMFMELLACSILDLIKGFGPMTEPVVRSYMQQAAAGLESLRLEGIVHRDVKPANMMLGHDGILKLTDFGLSPTSLNSSQHGLYPVGSPAYWAPELLNGQPHTHESDVWALGASVVQMLTGDTPYAELGFTRTEELAFHIGDFKGTPKIPDSTSRGLKQLLLRCFCKDGAARVKLPELANPQTYTMPFDAEQNTEMVQLGSIASDIFQPLRGGTGAFLPDEGFHNSHSWSQRTGTLGGVNWSSSHSFAAERADSDYAIGN